MPEVSGIPAGGLFNEMYAAHKAGRKIHARTVTDPNAPVDDVFAPSPRDEPAMRQVTVTRPRYVTVPKKKDTYTNWLWMAHCSIAVVAAAAFVLFVVGPIIEFGSGLSYLAGTLLTLCTLGVGVGTFQWLKTSWLKKHAGKPGELVRVQDGVEEVTEWVPDLDAQAAQQQQSRRAVDEAYAKRQARKKTVTTTVYPSLRVDKKWVEEDELQEQFRQFRNYVNATGNIPDWVNKEVAGFEKIFGAACEVTTARDVAALNIGHLYNDVILRGKDGKVSANIDHLLAVGSSTIMLDSKWWSTPPRFVKDRQGRIQVAATSPHKEAVSTCIYEASFLPQTPRAILFCVRGKAAREMGRPHVMESFHRFVPYEDGSQGVEAVPCPVVFVPSGQIKEAVLAVNQGGGMVAGTYVPAANPAPIDTRVLSRLEVTTQLTF